MSTPSERIFSAAGYISGQRRCQLSEEHVNQLVFFEQEHVGIEIHVLQISL